jgi:hypothetical protein
VFVDASHEVVVEGCYVHDCPHGGIDVSGTSLDDLASDVTVRGNLLDHNGQWGMHVVGSRVLVEGNEVSGTVQRHPKGEPAGNPGTDADGLLIFGDHHTIRANFIHDIADPTDVEHNIDPHADCIQTWDRQNQGGRPVMTDTVIEQNHCIIQHPTGKGLTMSAIYVSRHLSEGVLAANEGDQLRLCLRSELDAALYDEELTVITESAAWSATPRSSRPESTRARSCWRPTRG